ncbi:MAG TPA: hypothetical protein VI583_08085 [Cyclobacteriaceae bacterium]|nr:hypothetical protein [Cyclobacteriaceae bacterium]
MVPLNNFETGRLQSGILRHLITLLIAVLIIPNGVSAQGKKPDFSGKWTLNESKSKLDEGPFWGMAIKTTIDQKGNNFTSIRVTRGRDGEEMTMTEKLTLDGKECDNAPEGRRKSTASWTADGTSLTVKTHSIMERNGQLFEIDVTEVYTLQDKNTMVIEYTSESQRGERQRTQVYDRSM